MPIGTRSNSASSHWSAVLACSAVGTFWAKRVCMMHVRSEGISKFARFLGNDIEFGSDADEIAFPIGSAEWALVNADPRLSNILLKVCEESLSACARNASAFRVTVENTIAPLLPHGQSHANVVAAKLGMSERTLARRLAEEDVTFIEVLQQLKASLASRYLEDERMPISRIAWLLGFEDASSFSHACRRWTGKSPRELRRLKVQPREAKRPNCLVLAPIRAQVASATGSAASRLHRRCSGILGSAQCGACWS